ncbi:MAG: ChaN family lipoprotein [Planctomycetota bacterium]
MRIICIGLTGALLTVCLSSGCTAARRVDLKSTTGGNAALFKQFQAYDGRRGRPISFTEVVRRCAAADVIFFGEEHSDQICNQLEAQLLYALAAERRPLALAMEFFEVDTQPTLDAYLRRRIAEEPFRKESRQGQAYVRSHRPLVELCRATGMPVLATNAPRRLVRAYRKSGLDYEEYRAGLEPAEQRWLPLENEYLEGPYAERFFEMMSDHGPASMPAMPASMPAMPASMPAMPASMPAMPASMPAMPASMPAMPVSMPATAPASQPSSAPTTAATDTMPASQPVSQPVSQPASQPVSQPASMPAVDSSEMPHPPPVSQPAQPAPPKINVKDFYRAQLLWDQAMAESLAEFSERFTNHRLMLIVGVFHVAHDGGTATKYRQRHPRDHTITIVYRSTNDDTLSFDDADRDAGDIVIYGIEPPPEEEKPEPPESMKEMPPTES